MLRNADDESINFQKASCTLDGCVKIWTSRVDSVATETGKLLSGLAGAPEDASDDEDGDGAEPSKERERRRAARSEATLAKSFAALQVKKFDLEFTVDPLFKKTSADFDEGGAMGLLMNHLGIDGTGRVVFDSGDALVEEDSDDEDEEEDRAEDMVDIAKLREFLPPPSELSGLNISDTLNGFYFAADPKDTPDLMALLALEEDEEEHEPLEPGPQGEAVDFFGDDDYDAPAFDEGDVSMGGGAEGDDPFAAPSTAGPFATSTLVTLGGTDGNMFEYFDSGFGKAWAGAEHWKLKRVTRRPVVDPEAAREKRAAKAPFTIDFGPSAKLSSRELFATSSASTLLPKRRSGKKATSASRRRDEYLLPDDMHFSSRQLLRLFLKPKFALRTRRIASNNAAGEIDETFWAQAAQDREAGDFDDAQDTDMPFESQFFHDDDDFVDAALDAEGEDADDLRLETQGQELKRARPENVHYAKKAKRVDVKRLKDDIWNDLRAGLKIEAPDFEGDSERRASTASVPNGEAEGEGERKAELGEPATFDRVITSLRASYPRDKMSEISTSFCFICLLHLANEEGLKIETARTDGGAGDTGMKGYTDQEGVWDIEGVRPPPPKMVTGNEVDRIVGELQALRVFKDPTAGRAA